MNKLVVLGLLLTASTSASAQPGVGDPVYGARVEHGVTEVEGRYGRLTGGHAAGEDGLVMEAEHAFTSSFSVAGLIETGSDPSAVRRVNALAIEGVYALGKLKPLNVDTAVYAELKHGLRGESDAVEVKALFQHTAGRFDSRLNLIAERPLRRNESTEFGYAGSVDWAVADELRLGVAAFGDLGTSRHLLGRQEHFAGPEVKYDIEHVGPGEIGVEVGWLRAFGAAREETKGEARLLIGYEFHI